MIQKGTLLNVIDNSGAKTAYCIQVLSGYRRRYAGVGNIINVAVKSLRPKRKEFSKVKKGEIVCGVVVRLKRTKAAYSFENCQFSENSVVLINKQNKLIGTRVFGVVPKSFRYTKFLRIVSLSSGFVK